MINVVLPLQTVSEANVHQHWRQRQKRAKFQRSMSALILNVPITAQKLDKSTEPLTVTLTRLSKSRGLDSDNLASSQKHVRDGIADALGIDDRDPRVTWQYAQERAKEYGVRVEITKREGASVSI